MKKRILMLLLVFAMAFCVSACGNEAQTVSEEKDVTAMQEDGSGDVGTNDPTETDAKKEEPAKKDETAKKDEPAADQRDTKDEKANKSDSSSTKDGSAKKEKAKAESGLPVKDHGKLSVKGTQLVDAAGAPYQLQGVSTHGINWFPEYINKDGFMTMRDEWSINCVRLAMYTAESNSYCEGGNKDELKKLVNEGVDYATDLGLYVIIDWHILHDLDPNKYQSEAMAFFEEMSKKYADYDNVLYEICNEPNGGTSWSQVKSYAEKVIPIIRNNDPDAIIIVGTPTWSQDVDLAAKDPIQGYDNIMYTIHFYADTHRDNIRQKMLTALDAGIPVICTEFGICDASGSGANNISEGNIWIDTLNDNGVSYCIWNLSNKGETSSLIQSGCNKISGWTKDDLSEAGQWYVGILGKDVELLTSAKEQDDPSQEEENKTENQAKDMDASGKQNPSSNQKAESSAGDLKVTANCSNNWSDGSKQFYQYDLSIKNTGSGTVQGFTVQLDFESTVSVEQSWNGEFSVNGSSITVKPVDYNANIESGRSADIGFIICVEKETGAPKVTVK